MSKEIQIVNDKGRLNAEEIEYMLKEAEKNRNADKEVRIRVEHQNKLGDCAKNMLAFTEKPQFANQISPQQKSQIVQMANSALVWLNSNKEGNINAIILQQQILDNFFLPLYNQLKSGADGNDFNKPNEDQDADMEAP